MNKKGQLDGGIASFIFVLAGLLVVGVISFYFVNTTLNSIQPVLANQSAGAGLAINTIHSGFTGIWDVAIALLFIFMVVVLIYSSFMIDVHPAFIVVYIITLVILFIVTPYISSLISDIYNSVLGTDATTYLKMTSFIAENFGLIVLVIAIVSGIIIYGKLKSSSGGSIGAY